MIVSPQSFGDLLVAHAHAHAICSLGLFRPDGVFFPMEDLDFSGLEEAFRERLFRMLLQREKILPETADRFKAWEHSGFTVGWERKLEAHDRRRALARHALHTRSIRAHLVRRSWDLHALISSVLL